MPQIDALLSQMQQSGAQSATLRGDAPLQLQLPGGIAPGATLSSARLEEILGEILPADAENALSTEGGTLFDYASPLGVCRVHAQRNDAIISLKIFPNFNAAPQIAAPAPAISNDSGQKTAVLPPELRGFNWGGLLLSYIWAIGNKSYIGLLGLIPILGFFVRFFLGFKGNELAWRSRKWQSVEQFRATQKNWTIAGICIVPIGALFVLPIVAAILFPVFARARENARRSACQSQMKQIVLGVKLFSLENGGKAPSGTTMMSWKISLAKYVGNDQIYYCPSVTRGEESYLINRKIAGAKLDSIPAQTPLFYEAEVGHLGGKNVAFADGSLKWYRDEVFDAEILPLVE